MAVIVTGDFNALKVMFERDGDEAYRASLKAMDEKANEVVQKAKDNAPVDRYNLEEAITRYPKQERGATRKMRDPITGRYVKYKVEVGVERTVIDKETGKKVNVYQYDVVMHESDRAGHGSPENDKKRAEGKQPGNKYLERAFNEVDPTVVPEMIKRVKESI